VGNVETEEDRWMARIHPPYANVGETIQPGAAASGTPTEAINGYLKTDGNNFAKRMI
jgi:hypothetical protein